MSAPKGPGQAASAPKGFEQATAATGETAPAVVRLPAPCLVVLVGPSGAGKSTWAARQFRASQVVASDDLRALVGEGPDDQRAGGDAFDVLDLVIGRRLARGLVTLVDTLGLDAARRRGYVAAAREAGVSCHAVVFDTAPEVCRRRNRARSRPLPAAVLSGQLQALDDARAVIGDEGFDGVHAPGAVEVVPRAVFDAPAFSRRQREHPMRLRFGLQIPSFTFDDGAAALRERLGTIATAAEAVGFTSIWVMDHFLQIPQVGREWEDMLESYTTLGFLAARSETVRLGTLVTGITYRNVAHLAKIVATLDVISGGRANCGIGAAWFEREHHAYGWPFPPVGERFALLEDALNLLPMMWGAGSRPFTGRVISLPDTICYPRPLQEHIPILIGGGGERRTLALVARYADACNLTGDAATVRRKVGVLARHCEAAGRALEGIEITHLSTALTADDASGLARSLERLRPSGQPVEAFAARVNAATVADQIGRFRELAEAGVQTAIVSLPDVDLPEALDRFARVIDTFA